MFLIVFLVAMEITSNHDNRLTTKLRKMKNGRMVRSRLFRGRSRMSRVQLPGISKGA